MTHTDRRDDRRAARTAKGTRDRLVRAALDLFTTKGYHESTTPQIAARAGVAEGTIYRHFSSKEQLFNEIFRAGLRLFAGGVGRIDQSSSCAERLAQVSTEWQHLAQRNPPLVPLVFTQDHGNTLDARSREAMLQLRAAIEQLMAQGKAAGDVRAGSAATLAEMWMRLVALVLERVATGEWQPGDPASRHVTDSAWDAVRSQAGQVEGNR